jgi:hypothetical protein
MLEALVDWWCSYDEKKVPADQNLGKSRFSVARIIDG